MKLLRKGLCVLFIFSFTDLFGQNISAEKEKFTRQDSLRGSITDERIWWDLNFYHLDIKIDPEKKFIQGSNTIHYRVLKSYQVMQVDLQEPLYITQIFEDGRKLNLKEMVIYISYT